MFFSGKLQVAEYSRSEEYTRLSLISWQGEAEGRRISLYTPSSTSLPRHSLPATGQHKTPGWIDISPGTIWKTLKSYLLRYAWRLNIYKKYTHTVSDFWHLCKNLALSFRKKRTCVCVWTCKHILRKQDNLFQELPCLSLFTSSEFPAPPFAFSGVQRSLFSHK